MKLKRTSEIESEFSNSEEYSALYCHYGEKELRDKIQPALLEILADFDFVCQSADIFYVLVGGALLGAVRSKKFIPWDDDIDVAVRPEGYARLREAIRKAGFTDRYQFIPADASKEVSLDGKFMSKSVTLGDLIGDTCLGHPLYIDILVIEDVPDNGLMREIRNIAVKVLTLSYNSLRTLKSQDELLDIMSRNNHVLRNNLLIRRIAAFPAAVLGRHRTFRLLKWFSSYQNRNTKNVTIPFGVLMYKGEMVPRRVFSSARKIEFEGRLFNAPQDYKGYLKNRYGKNYMTPPPENEWYVKCFKRKDNWKEILNKKKG